MSIQRMRPIFFLMITLMASCKSKTREPDVSGISINLSTARFEADFFEADSANILSATAGKYPVFTPLFFQQVLGLTPEMPKDTAISLANEFRRYYRSVYDRASALYSDFTPYEKEIREGFKRVKYYFSDYALPERLVTFIGPADGVGEALGNKELYIGLQAHLGADFPLYQTEMIVERYPGYVTKNFTKDFIAINSLKAIVDDIYPETSADGRLIAQMVENGKRLYILQRMLPEQPEHRILGYSEKEWKDTKDNEAAIWDFFLRNNLLQSADKSAIRNYISPGPKTPELSDSAPGNIGSFAGLQIVKKFMEKKQETKLTELMAMKADLLYAEAKYKP